MLADTRKYVFFEYILEESGYQGEGKPGNMAKQMITSAEDVAFDMDEVIIEEDDYYTDGTITSDSYNDSEGFLEDGVEDIEL